ncbi:sulfite exporter TauE/SafE [Nitzschia inconspicua]|uniref:Sulfite exporter TauE/SafE n=1 Tax=Nitzschia inconspicua TaxID=303405 RepID=A0A9K3KB73_9STRA|nr:sulfite exporter TauE/SafE [Nitzschia inconspicua]
MTTSSTLRWLVLLLLLMLQLTTAIGDAAATIPVVLNLENGIVSSDNSNIPLVSSFGYGGDQVVPIHDRFLALIGDELPPLFPFQWRDYLGFGVAVVGLLLAAGGGIGGGGILVPTYILLLGFPVKRAISLVSVTVFGGAIANNLLNARKRHPDHDHRSVIDWTLILQLEPMTIAGTIFGTLLNKALPALLLVVLMVALLSYTAHKTLTKANELNQKENEAAAKAQQRGSKGETQPLIADSKPMDVERQDTDELDLDEDYLSTQADVWSATRLAVLFAIITALNLLSGKQGGETNSKMGTSFNCGPWCFWTAEVAMIVVIFVFVIFERRSLLRRIDSGVPIYSDIVWTKENTVRYPCYSMGAGLVAGLFGVGGGIINGPLMLALGVHPAVASASSACMILFTSLTATLSFMAFGILVPDYAIFCLVIGFVSTALGQLGMSVLLKRYQRNSYIAYCIGLVVAISAVAMVIESIAEIMHS